MRRSTGMLCIVKLAADGYEVLLVSYLPYFYYLVKRSKVTKVSKAGVEPEWSNKNSYGPKYYLSFTCRISFDRANLVKEVEVGRE